MRPAARRPGLLAAAALAACAHAAPSPLPQGPVPDREAVREALEGCPPGAASRGCPPERFEPLRYVSARSYRHLIGALLARQREDLAAASSELREALLYDPESPHLHTQLADALVRMGHVAEAEEELHAALQQDPQHATARVLLGRIAAARGHAAEARAHFRAAQEAAPDAPEPLRERVRLEVAQGDLAAAASVAQALEELAIGQTQASAAAERATREEQFFSAERADPAPSTASDPSGALLVRAARLREEAALGWLDLGRGQADRREDAAASESFGRAEAIDPTLLDAVAARAVFLESRRRFGEARDAELRLYARRPDAPEVIATLSRLSLEAGDLDAAEVHLRKLVALSGELEPAPVANGEAQGDEPPERPEARRELAGALLRAGLPLLGARRTGGALAAFDAGLRMLPGHPELAFYRGLVLAARGRAREAAALFDNVALQLSRPGAAVSPPLLGLEASALQLDARVQASLARGRAGEVPESLRRLRALFAEQPTAGEVALGLLEGLDRAGRAPEAVAAIEAALHQHPGHPALLFALATAQDRSQHQADALQTMRKLLALQPDHAGALNYVGYTLAEKGGPGELAEAEPLLARAVELRPDDGAIADSYGLLLLRRGRPAEALGELRRADALTPGDPVILSHLGDALLATGNRAEAQAAFRAALDRLQQGPDPKKLRSRRADARVPRGAQKGADAEEADPEPARLPEPGDARVRAELEEKLRSLTAR